MQERCKWQQPKRNMMFGDIVILRDENTPRNVWPSGLVVQIELDAQGFVRTVVVQTQESEHKRPVSKVVLLLAKEDQ